MSIRSGARHKGRLAAAFALLAVFMVVEVVAGFATGSSASVSTRPSKSSPRSWSCGSSAASCAAATTKTANAKHSGSSPSASSCSPPTTSVEALRDLFFVDAEASQSTVGIVLAALSLIVMPVLAVVKRRTATALGSPTLRADAAETKLCSWLSAVLLGGLVLNATVGWWWADPLAAIVIAGLAASEGFEAWRGESCDDECED